MGEPATTEGYIEGPGGRVWYRIAGTDRPGIPVLCLHGGPGMPHDYRSENSSRMAFVEERESYIRVVEDFLGRVEAGVADET